MVLIASAVQVPIFLRVGDWIGTTAVLALAYLMAAAAGAGFFAGRRPALAGVLAVIGGAVAYAAVSYLTREAAADLWALLGWEARLIVSVIPYAIAGAVAGHFGGVLRRRIAPG